MKKTLPREDFELSSINEDFIFTTKIGILHSYFKLPFYKRWNYDFSELPILNFIDKFNLSSMRKRERLKQYVSDYFSEIRRSEEERKKIKEDQEDLKNFCEKLRQNIKNDFIKHKMYKNITHNFKEFSVNELYRVFINAPEEELVFFINKIKKVDRSTDFDLLLKGLIFYAVNVNFSKCEEILKNIKNLNMNKNELEDFINLCENKNMLHLYECFKDSNKAIYYKMFRKYTEKNISNF